MALDGVEHFVLYDTVEHVTLTERSRDGRVPPMLRIHMTESREIVLRQDTLKTLPDIAREIGMHTRS